VASGLKRMLCSHVSCPNTRQCCGAASSTAWLISTLETAGFIVERTYGDFSRAPIADSDGHTTASVEYILIARHAS